MTNARDALEALGIDPDELEKSDAELRERRGRRSDPRICLCGHGIARHVVVNGITLCKPSRMECPCKRARPVLEAADTRKFIRKTNGGGMLHALVLGMMSHIDSGKPVTWIIDLKCDRCGVEGVELLPTPVTQHGKATTYATGYDALLCKSCRSEI